MIEIYPDQKDYEFTKLDNEDIIIHNGAYRDISFENCKLRSVTIDGDIANNGSAIFKDCTIEKVKFTENTNYIPERMFITSAIGELDLGNVKIIGPEAFNASGIGKIKWSNKLKVINVGAFMDCYLPEAIDFPNGLLVIKDNAFMNCENLKKITLPDSLRAICSGAFLFDKLKEIKIPEFVDYIGEDIISKINSIQAYNTAPHIKEKLEEYTDNLTLLPSEYKQKENNCIINNNILYSVMHIPDLLIDNEIKEIMPYAFSQSTDEIDWTGKDLIFKNLEKLNSFAFHDIDSINSISLSKKCKSIPPYTFAFCEVIKSDMPGLEKIEPYGFAYADLNEFDLSNIKELDKYAFLASELSNVVVPGHIKEIPVGCFACNPLEGITIEEGVEIIAESAFQGSFFVSTSIKLPNTLKSIDKYAFNGNIIFQNEPENVEIKIPPYIEYIHEDFANPSYKIKIPANLEDKIKKEIYKNVEVYDLSLNDLIDCGKTVSEINQLLKTQKDNCR